MNKYQKILAFYQAFLAVLKALGPEDEMVKSELAQPLIDCWGQVVGHVSLPKIDKKFVKDMPFARDLGECIRHWAFSAFQDLAPHLRDPKAQQVLKDILENLRFDRAELFVQEKGVRLLGKRRDGPAVVTLVVQNYEALHDLLSQPSVEDSVVKEILSKDSQS